VLLASFEPRDHHPVRHRNTGRAEDGLGQILLHGECRGEHARMAVGHADRFQDPLDRSVLTRPAMQQIEGNVGPERLQHRGDVAADVDASRLVALCLQRLGAGLARAQRNLALGRPASHQDRHVLPGHWNPSTANSE
jgi:hypothetical protein